MSLSGGLIPLGGGGGGLKPMTDSAQSSPSKDAGFDEDFDAMLDEILEAPTRKSRNKSSKPKKKKSSSRGRSSAQDSPISSPTKSDVPLSPHLEESVDDNTFYPRNVAAADLDDSILGGLMGGGGRKLHFKASNVDKITEDPSPSNAVAAAPLKHKDLSVKIADDFDDSFAASLDDSAVRIPASTTATATATSSFTSSAVSRPATTMSSSLRNVKSWDDPQPVKPTFGSRRAKSTVVSNTEPHESDTSQPAPAKEIEATPQSAAPATAATSIRTKTFSFNDSFNDDDLLPLPMGPEDSKNSVEKTAMRGADDNLPAPSLIRGDSSTSNTRLNTASSVASGRSDDINSRPITADASVVSHESLQAASTAKPEPIASEPAASATMEAVQKPPDSVAGDVDIGFMPSFLEGGRDTRRRRQLGSRNASSKSVRSRPTSSGAQGDSMDALDRALGLGPPTAGPGTGGTASGRILKSLGDSAELGNASPDEKRSYHRPLSEHPTSASFRNTVEVTEDKQAVTTGPARRESQEREKPVATNKQDLPVEKQHQAISLPSLTTPSKSSLYLDIHSMSRNNDDNSDEDATTNSAPQHVATGRETSRAEASHRDHDAEHHHHHKATKTPRKSHTHSLAESSTAEAADQSLDSSMAAAELKEKAEMPTPTPRTSGIVIKRSSSSFETTSASKEHSASKRDLHRTQSALNASQAQQSQTSQATPPKRASGQSASWLHAPSAGASTALATATYAGGNQDQTVRQLHQKIDELQIQKDAVEKYLRLEIEELRRGQMGEDSGTARDGTGHDTSRSHDYVEMAELKAKLAVLTTENSRLKEELALDSARRSRELNMVRDRHEADMESAGAARNEEIAMLERRHAEAIQQLKNMHLEEIAAIKQRVRDGSALEGLTTQIKSTSGSLKMLEEKMSLQYRGIDAVREGQFEARERLLEDMEAKARERAEAAEKEGYRLKGMLSHMEQMVTNLRSQNGEERERLRQEHMRLDALQQSLESERLAMRSRVSDEMASVQQKVQEHLKEVRAWKEEKLRQQCEIQEQRRSLEADKAEFAAHVANSVKSAESTAKRLKEEEEKLQTIRKDIEKDVAALEQKRADALADLKAAAAWRATMASAEEEIRRERAALQEAAQALQEASDTLLHRDKEINKKVEYLQQTEREVQNARGELESALHMLRQREAEIADAARYAENQKLSIKMLEDTMLQKRVTASSLLREASRKQSEAAKLTLANPSSPAHINKVAPSLPSPQSVASTSPPIPPRASPMMYYDDAVPGIDLGNAQEELAKAKRAMQKARGGLSTASNLKIETQSFLLAEQDFFNKINRSR